MDNKILLILLLGTIFIYLIAPVQSFALGKNETGITANKKVNLPADLIDCSKILPTLYNNKVVYLFKGILDGNLYNNIQMDNFNKKNFYININNLDSISNKVNDLVKGSIFFTQNNTNKYLSFTLTDLHTQCITQIFDTNSIQENRATVGSLFDIKNCKDMGITLNGVTFSNLDQKNQIENKTFNLKITVLGPSFNIPVQLDDRYKATIDFANKYISLDVDKAEFSCLPIPRL